jgi:hypothetical protein
MSDSLHMSCEWDECGRRLSYKLGNKIYLLLWFDFGFGILSLCW